jgi:hypothetical protein
MRFWQRFVPTFVSHCPHRLLSVLTLVANLGRLLGSLRHESGTGRLAGGRQRSAGKPGAEAHEVEGDRRQDVLQVGLREADLARTTQAGTTQARRMRTFDAGSLSGGERWRLFAFPRRPQSLLLRLGMQRQTAPHRRGTAGVTRTVTALGCGKGESDHRARRPRTAPADGDLGPGSIWRWSGPVGRAPGVPPKQARSGCGQTALPREPAAEPANASRHGGPTRSIPNCARLVAKASASL